ncbi:DUF5723 family protein [Paraflavitalea sp. CAU 1676]|uniref:DUF5723 family protein n=1 Tax=Paraflavitalea sp. CAU 1676 TaxID=3032598 RepID=UPI0023DAD8D3|nr:DUF5723 family protein [Paraflavitalea sp. CAU 1676]MDF2193035.1 DUF5723 family protein [Paraflavitalea sp. CAU 1676]
MFKQLNGQTLLRRLIVPSFLCSALVGYSQDYTGYRTGNYTGVNGVFFNPANIADSRYRWDVNLVSVSVLGGNNQASFKLKNLSESFNADSLENQLYGKNAGPTNGIMSVGLIGPSFMFNVSPKTSIALTTRSRVMANVQDVDGTLLQQVIDGYANGDELPYTITSAKNMVVNMNAWTEFGASVGQVILDKEKHFLKGGVTLKYLAGVGNTYLQLKQLSTTINEDKVSEKGYLSNTTGRIGIGFGGASFDNFEADDLTTFDSKGFGVDIGFVYEFRPDQAKYRSGDKYDWKRNENKYKLRVGLALLDIGAIKYKRDLSRSGAYDLGVTGVERFYLSELKDVDLDDYKQFFDNRPQYFTAVAGSTEGDYKVALPTTIQLDVDYNLHKKFYISLAGQFSLINSDSKPYNSQYRNTFTLTPRYETRLFSAFLPLNYNELTKFNAGLSLRFGPVFLGSGSVITALLGESKQADAHIGIRFGILHKDKSGKKKVAEKPAEAANQ